MPPTGPVGRTRGAPPKLTVGTTATERTPPMKGSMAPMVPALRKFLVFVSLAGFLSWCAYANGGSGVGEYRALTRTRVRGKDRNTSLPGRSPPDPRRETRTRAPGAARTHRRVESYLFWEVAQGPTRWVRGGVDVRSRRGEGRRRRKAAREGGGGRRGSENFVAHVRLRLTCATRPRTNDDSTSTSKEDVETPLRRPNHPMRGKMKRFSNAATGPEPSVKPISNREWWFPKLAKADEQN